MSSSASESAAEFPDCHSRMTQEELKQFLEFMEADELSSDEDPSVGNDVESSHNLDELAKERQMEEAKMANSCVHNNGQGEIVAGNKQNRCR